MIKLGLTAFHNTPKIFILHDKEGKRKLKKRKGEKKKNESVNDDDEYGDEVHHHVHPICFRVLLVVLFYISSCNEVNRPALKTYIQKVDF